MLGLGRMLKGAEDSSVMSGIANDPIVQWPTLRKYHGPEKEG